MLFYLIIKIDNKVIKNDLIQKPKKRIINESRYIQWVNPYEPINKNKIGSSQAWRKRKEIRILLI